MIILLSTFYFKCFIFVRQMVWANHYIITLFPFQNAKCFTKCVSTKKKTTKKYQLHLRLELYIWFWLHRVLNFQITTSLWLFVLFCSFVCCVYLLQQTKWNFQQFAEWKERKESKIMYSIWWTVDCPTFIASPPPP